MKTSSVSITAYFLSIFHTVIAVEPAGLRGAFETINKRADLLLAEVPGADKEVALGDESEGHRPYGRRYRAAGKKVKNKAAGKKVKNRAAGKKRQKPPPWKRGVSCPWRRAMTHLGRDP